MKLTAFPRLIVWVYWHLWCTGTWWVSIRTVGLHLDEVGTLVNWCWGISLTPWLVSINTGASIKYPAKGYRGKDTVSTTSGWRICWRCSCSWPNGKISNALTTIIRNKSNGYGICVCDDVPRFCCFSTVSGVVIVRTQIQPIIFTFTIGGNLNIKFKKGYIDSLSVLNCAWPGLCNNKRNNQYQLQDWSFHLFTWSAFLWYGRG